MAPAWWLKLVGEKPIPIRHKIVLVGFDRSGKTTFLKKFGKKLTIKKKQLIPDVPPIEEVTSKGGINIVSWDMDKRTFAPRRELLQLYGQGASGFIFCVNTTDKEWLPYLRSALNKHMAVFPGKPVVVFANFQDCSDSVTPDEISQELGLHYVMDRQYKVMGGSTSKGQGVDDAVNWVCKTAVVSQR